MAISSIISFGFGNGTFSPGVGYLPTLGYGNIGGAVGPYCFEAIATFSGGAEATKLASGGSVVTATHSGGAEIVKAGC